MLAVGFGVLAGTFQNCGTAFEVMPIEQASNAVPGGTSGVDLMSGPIMKVAEKLYQPFGSVALDPNNSQIIYAQGLSSQMVMRSVDAGATWIDLCLGNEGGVLVVDPSGPRAYLNSYQGIFEVAELNGAPCKKLISGSPQGYFAVSSSGQLYFGPSRSALKTSADHGATWSTVVDPMTPASLITTNAQSLKLMPDPEVPGAMLVNIPSGTTTNLSFRNADGSVWGTGSVPSDPVVVRLNGSAAAIAYHFYDRYPSVPAQFPIIDPLDPNKVYFPDNGVFGRVSTDGGATTRAMTTQESFKWMGPDGKTYRFRSTGDGSYVISRATSFGANDWQEISITKTYPEFTITKAGALLRYTESDTKIHVSSDAGQTWKAIGREQPIETLHISSFVAEGSRIYAANEHYVFRSDDGGLTWHMKHSLEGSDFSSGAARLKMSPSNPDLIYLYGDSEAGSTYAKSSFTTSDGFGSMTKLTDRLLYSWSSLLALGLDGKSAMALSMSVAHLSTPAGLWSQQTWTAATNQPDWFIWYPWHSGYLSPSDPNVALFGETAGATAAAFYEYSYTTNVQTNVTTRLPFQYPVGMTMRNIPMNGAKIYVISHSGAIAESTDGITFTQKSNSFRPEDSAIERMILNAIGDTGLEFVAAVYGGRHVWATTDGGSTWKHTELQGECEIRDVVKSARGYLVACAESEPKLVDFAPKP